MVIKKINSVCSLLTSAVLLCHSAAMGFSLLTGRYSYSLCKALAHSAAGMVCLHAILSIIIVMLCHDGANFSKYAKLNKKTVIQRASCILMAVLLHMHITAFGFIASGEALTVSGKVMLLVTELLFFSSVYSHLAVSFGNSLVSLGLIRKESALKKTQCGAYAVCGTMMLFITVSLIKFTALWSGFAG